MEQWIDRWPWFSPILVALLAWLKRQAVRESAARKADSVFDLLTAQIEVRHVRANAKAHEAEAAGYREALAISNRTVEHQADIITKLETQNAALEKRLSVGGSGSRSGSVNGEDLASHPSLTPDKPSPTTSKSRRRSVPKKPPE